MVTGLGSPRNHKTITRRTSDAELNGHKLPLKPLRRIGKSFNGIVATSTSCVFRVTVFGVVVVVKSFTGYLNENTWEISRLDRCQWPPSANTLRLVEVFVIAKRTYIPRGSNTDDLNIINALVGKSVKHGIGLPTSTFTDKHLRVGLCNTAEELIEGHLHSQRARLRQAKDGREKFSRIGGRPSTRPSKCGCQNPGASA